MPEPAVEIVLVQLGNGLVKATITREGYTPNNLTGRRETVTKVLAGSYPGVEIQEERP